MTSFHLIGDAFGPSSENAIRSALRRVLGDARTVAASRGDGVAFDEFVKVLDKHVDGQLAALRVDGIGPTGGGLGAGKLRHVYAEVLNEERPLPNGLAIFPTDTSVPLGAKDHEVTRVYASGEARVWRGAGSQLPTVNMAQASKVFPIRYYVTQILWDVFEDLAENVANIGRLQLLARAARDVLEAFANQKVWWGDDASGIYGVLNYPWVTRLSLANTYDLAATVTDTEAHVRELVRLVSYPTLNSKQVFAPNRLAMGTKMHAFLAGTLVKSSSALTPISLLERFLAANPYIRSEAQIDICWELDDAFASGVSAVVAFRQDRNTVANVIPGGGIQTLPIVDEGFTKYQPMFLAHGGIVMRRVGDVVVGMVDTSA